MTNTQHPPAPPAASLLPVGARVRLLSNHLTAENRVLHTGREGVIVVWRSIKHIAFNGGDMLPLSGADFEVIE